MNLDHHNLQTIIGTCRILFGIIAIVKTLYLISAYDLNWAFRRPKFLMPLLFTLIFCFVLMIAGIQTGPASFAAMLIYLYLFHFSIFYGLENIIFQTFLLYFSVSGAGSFAYAQGDLWGRLPQATSFFPEICLTLAIGMTWFSASMNKCKDPLWKKGLGAYYFFLLPIWRRGPTSIFTRSKSLMYFLNYSTVFFQLMALPSFLFFHKLGLFSAVSLLIFSLSLSTLFIMTWLGELLSLASSIILVFFLRSGLSVYPLWKIEIANALDQGDTFAIVLHALAIFTLFAGFWVSCVTIWTESIAKIPIMSALNRFLRYVSRYTWGLSVTKVFTSLHIQGPVLFRIYLVFTDGEIREVFQMTNIHGFPASRRNFKPTFVESISTKLTEVCMELDAFGEIQTSKRKDFLLAFCKFLIRSESRNKQVQSIRFDSIQLIPPNQFEGANEWFRKIEWVSAFQVEVISGNCTNVKKTCEMILQGPTGRDLQRNSFTFKDNIKQSIY